MSNIRANDLKAKKEEYLKSNYNNNLKDKNILVVSEVTNIKCGYESNG